MNVNVVLGISAVAAVILGLVAGWLVWGRRRSVDIAAPTLDAAPPAPTLRRKPTPAELQAQLATFNPPQVDTQVQDPDNLMQLKGVGPRLAKTLYEMVIGKFEQIASWTDADIARISGPFRGGSSATIGSNRHNFLPQAIALDSRHGSASWAPNSHEPANRRDTCRGDAGLCGHRTGAERPGS
jgi:predicted flap endonuclease-1-like 5' DNA nuclease